MMLQLSVVLITRNQRWNIARLIESVLANVPPQLSHEIVLVDSASTDDTVTVASRYPATIIRLHSGQRLTAAAGRYVGYKHSTGEFILFLDGDMELVGGFLQPALALMGNTPELGIVSGKIIDRPLTTLPTEKSMVEQSEEIVVQPARYAGGAALYRRAVLDTVGSFRPYLYSEEEPELCIRLRQAGHRVAKFDHVIALHYTDPRRLISTVISRWRRRLYLGYGQNLRQNFGTILFWLYVKERGYWIAPAAALSLGGVLLVISRITGNWRWLGGWGLLLAFFLAADALRKRSFYATLYSLVLRLVILDGAIRGLFIKPLSPAGYLQNLEVVRSGPVSITTDDHSLSAEE